MITGVVLTKNEHENCARCLNSLKFCDRLLVIDDNSTDDTALIAKKYGAKVIYHPLADDFSTQRNFALAQVKTGWVLFIDADEQVPSKLVQELRAAITNTQKFGFFIPRLDFIWGKTLHHGDTGKVKLLRLGLADKGSWIGQVHETWNIPGPVGELHSPISHFPHPTISAFLTEINRYSSMRANELFKNGRKSSIIGILLLPIGKFLLLYLIKLGFLDGTAGFVHAMIMAFYTFMVQGKLYLLHKGIS
jgi:glycosyltransferase involved in cell wall biosynthesis